MLKFMNEQELLNKLEDENQKKLLLNIFNWVEDTFEDIYATNFGYGVHDRQRRFISVDIRYSTSFEFQLHHITPEQVGEKGFECWEIDNHVNIKSTSIKTEEGISKLKELIMRAYESVPLDISGVSNDKILMAEKVCSSYESTIVNGLTFKMFNSKCKVVSDDKIIPGDSPLIKVGSKIDKTNKVKYKFFSLEGLKEQLFFTIAWGEILKDRPYHLKVYINSKPVIECYLPRWLYQAKDGFKLLIPNVFPGNVNIQDLRNELESYLKSELNDTGLTLDDNKIFIELFTGKEVLYSEFIEYFEKIIALSIVRGSIRGIIDMGINDAINQEFVSNALQVIKNIENFNKEFKDNPIDGKRVLTNCAYFVTYNNEFASVKYAAWKDVTIQKYFKYREIDNDDFHASKTQKALEDTGFKVSNDEELKKAFEKWKKINNISSRDVSEVTIYTIDSLIPFIVSTTGKTTLAIKTPEKAHFEVYAASKYVTCFPAEKVDFEIKIGHKKGIAQRQNNSKNEVYIGKCRGEDYKSIRDIVLDLGLKLRDRFFLRVIEPKEKYELLVDDTIRSVDGEDVDTIEVLNKGIIDFEAFIKNKGFNFNKEMIVNYILALKAKPFVILSGISGTGKTKIAQFFAQFMCPDEEVQGVIKRSSRYGFISVRPDWVDNRSLLGYYNPITEKYQATELLKLMLRAEKDVENPYFVILDEMNLAKVEYYFSDFLSCLESRRDDGSGTVISENIILHDSEEELKYIDDDGTEYTIPKKMMIPINLYFTGTVNVDETTYMFSPKVLDRANVIEFNEVDMDNYKSILSSDNSQNGQEIKPSEDFIRAFTDDSDFCTRLIKKDFDTDLDVHYSKLKEINDILKKYHLHFGYRVIDEILMYLTYGREVNKDLTIIDMDLQILQKVLPKFHGSRQQLEIPLSKLLRFCFGTNIKDNERDNILTNVEREYIEQYDFDGYMDRQYSENVSLDYKVPSEIEIKAGVDPIFPRSSRKLFRMLNILDKMGFTSFIE